MTSLKRPSIYVIAAFLLAASLIAESPGRAAIVCSPTTCTCKGDVECNIMFKDKCTDSGGTCKNDSSGSTSCSCARKASISAPRDTGKNAVRPEKVEGLKGVKQ